jgi:hypothetical protein
LAHCFGDHHHPSFVGDFERAKVRDPGEIGQSRRGSLRRVRFAFIGGLGAVTVALAAIDLLAIWGYWVMYLSLLRTALALANRVVRPVSCEQAETVAAAFRKSRTST